MARPLPFEEDDRRSRRSVPPGTTYSVGLAGATACPKGAVLSSGRAAATRVIMSAGDGEALGRFVGMRLSHARGERLAQGNSPAGRAVRWPAAACCRDHHDIGALRPHAEPGRLLLRLHGDLLLRGLFR
jgi:hypothetical protein